MIARVLPLLLLPALIYVGLWAIWGAHLDTHFAAPLLSIHMISGETWTLTVSAVFLLFAIFCMFVEIVRSVTPTTWSIAENLASAIAFAIGIVLFLAVRGFATTEFFVVVVLLLLDFVTDFVVMTISARRTVQYENR